MNYLTRAHCYVSPFRRGDKLLAGSGRAQGSRQVQAKAQLFESKLAEARSTSLSRRPGRRFRALALLEEAKQLARELQLHAEKLYELRNATLLALTRSDLYQDPERTWAGFPDGSTFVDFDDPSLTNRK